MHENKCIEDLLVLIKNKQKKSIQNTPVNSKYIWIPTLILEYMTCIVFSTTNA